MQVPNTDLVPGDLLSLENRSNWTLPCDMVLIEGSAICDESGLTGESMPVRKSELPDNDGEYDAGKDAKHSLFAGTTLLQETGAFGVVCETGIRTAKGEIVSAILYPASMIFEYDEELVLVFTMLSCYAVILFLISVYLQLRVSPQGFVTIFSYAAFTVSQVLPPLLPVAFRRT